MLYCQNFPSAFVHKTVILYSSNLKLWAVRAHQDGIILYSLTRWTSIHALIQYLHTKLQPTLMMMITSGVFLYLQHRTMQPLEWLNASLPAWISQMQKLVADHAVPTVNSSASIALWFNCYIQTFTKIHAWSHAYVIFFF